MSGAPLPAIPPDPGIPGARGLFGETGTAVVSEFLSNRGWSADEVRPVQALYRPGRSAIVRYRAQASRGGSGRRMFSICAETRARYREPVAAPPRAGGLPQPVDRWADGLVWAWPYDPELEPVPLAARGEAVREALEREGDVPAAVVAEPLRYRPRRRAVFRYRMLRRSDRGRRWKVAYGKSLSPTATRRALELSGSLSHRGRLRLGLPTGAPTGTLLIPSLPGRSLRELLLEGKALPSPDRVARLLDELPRTVMRDGVPRVAEDPLRSAERTARFITTLLPELEREVRRVVEGVAVGAGTGAVPSRVVHGDLYEAQIIVGDGFRLGLIDLDDVAMGDPARDAGTFCAHLLALALSVPAARDRLIAYRTLARRSLAGVLGIDPSLLAWREALAMLHLATGPFRVLDRAWPRETAVRVNLAVRLLEAS